MTKEAIAKAPARRPQRAPIGQKNRLTVTNRDPNFEYRIVNDTEDRVEIFKENGWEVVPAKDVRVGDRRVENPSSEGSAAYVSVGMGQKATVMRLNKEWYDEDQRAKQAEIDKIEQSMKEDALDGNYGKLEISRK